MSGQIGSTLQETPWRAVGGGGMGESPGENEENPRIVTDCRPFVGGWLIWNMCVRVHVFVVVFSALMAKTMYSAE